MPWTSHEVSGAYTTAPTSTHGKVFFTLGGVDYVCSGTALLSGNKSVVWTAGHCTNEGPGDFANDKSLNPPSMAIGCDMTGGSSGGGWIVGSSVYSVNSYGYNNQPDVMYGPYQGDVAQSLYAASAG